MEIYTNAAAANRTVFLEFPDAVTSVDCFVYQDGVELFEIATVTAIPSEGFSAVLPLHLLQHDSDYKVHWTVKYLEPSDGEEYTINRVTPVEVVTPILTASEIRAIDSVVFAEDSEVFKIEKAVRHIIQAYTGQEFGHFIGTERVKGDGGPALFLPHRIIELIEVNGAAVGNHFSVDPDGYILRQRHSGPTYGFPEVPPVKADFYGYHMHVGGVIHNPNNVSLRNWTKETHSIYGRWGYETVPAAVKEAAKLLVNDYACADSQYRDRYLQSMTAADWRIQFNSGAFLRTGNVRADQLLSDFVVTRGWGVI